jgi:hypothetical protein
MQSSTTAGLLDSAVRASVRFDIGTAFPFRLRP